MDDFTSWAGITAGVGTAAMGLVEALKVLSVPLPGGRTLALSTLGLGKVKRQLGSRAMRALKEVYGPDSMDALLEGAWRKGPDELGTILRNGLRMAVFACGSPPSEGAAIRTLDEGKFFAAFGQPAEEVTEAVRLLRAGEPAQSVGKGAELVAATAAGQALSFATARERVARLEAAIDARVLAAVASGRDAYVSGMHLAASVVSVGGCLAFYVSAAFVDRESVSFSQALLVGLLAVPVAPVAKDLVSFLGSLRNVFDRRPAAA